MDERLARNISNIGSLEDLSQLEANARAKQALDLTGWLWTGLIERIS